MMTSNLVAFASPRCCLVVDRSGHDDVIGLETSILGNLE